MKRRSIKNTSELEKQVKSQINNAIRQQVREENYLPLEGIMQYTLINRVRTFMTVLYKNFMIFASEIQKEEQVNQLIKLVFSKDLRQWETIQQSEVKSLLQSQLFKTIYKDVMTPTANRMFSIIVSLGVPRQQAQRLFNSTRQANLKQIRESQMGQQLANKIKVVNESLKPQVYR